MNRIFSDTTKRTVAPLLVLIAGGVLMAPAQAQLEPPAPAPADPAAAAAPTEPAPAPAPAPTEPAPAPAPAPAVPTSPSAPAVPAPAPAPTEPTPAPAPAVPTSPSAPAVPAPAPAPTEPTPAPAPAPAPTPVSTQTNLIQNYSFESGTLSSWSASGAVRVVAQPYGGTNGVASAIFSYADVNPDGILSQSFATTIGKIYTLQFDFGAYTNCGVAVNTSRQRLQVSAAGVNGQVLNVTATSPNAIGCAGTVFGPQTFTFTATSAQTTLTFRDITLFYEGHSNDGVLDNIRVTSINNAPVAAAQSASTDEDTALTGTVTATDAENDTRTYSNVAGPSHGVVTVNADGTFTYTPDANYHGQDSFAFKANDGTVDSNEATVSISVNPINDAPVAANDTTGTNEDANVTIDVLGNDTDIDGDTLQVTAATSAEGTVTINENGTLGYTPAANFNGAVTINYTISDGNGGTAGGTVTVTVQSVNDVPVAVEDSAATLSVTPVTVQVLNNDSDVETAATSLTTNLVSGAPNGTVTRNADGSFTYTPAVGFAGTDSFSYTAGDGEAVSAPVTVTITVTQPATTIGDKITGGGSFTGVDGVAGSIASATLNVQSDAKGGSLKGKVDYSASQEGIYIRSTLITGLVQDGKSARIFGKATLNGAGSYDFVVDVVDEGEPGNADTFRISLSNGYTNGPKALVAGNLQVHN